MLKSKPSSKDVLDTRLHGTRTSAFMNELFSNSAHFLILKSLSDLILIGWASFITDPTEYLLALAMLVQAWDLSRPSAHRFWGNLTGVTVYTALDLPVDGLEFFQNPTHIVFWLFSLVIATLQGLRFHWATGAKCWIIPLESLARTLMVVACYIVIGLNDRAMSPLQQILKFKLSDEHWFLLWSMVLVGLLLGLQSLQITEQRQQLQETAGVLRNMAEWGMGSHAVAAAVHNPEALAFHKCERTIIFMDIRGFTAWCEQRKPDTVAAVLNKYYRSVEPAAAQHLPLRITFTADEVMAIYATPQQGVAAARDMRQAALQTLTPYKIGAGCAVHCGSVVEGLFGSEGVRTYTVIGDVVNTAKRLETATPAGEITVSDALYQALGKELAVEPCKPIVAKGKTEAIVAWRLLPS
jgi:class 3 adenylate cyclase